MMRQLRQSLDEDAKGVVVESETVPLQPATESDSFWQDPEADDSDDGILHLNGRLISQIT